MESSTLPCRFHVFEPSPVSRGLTTHLQALLASLDGGNITSDTTADDNQVLFLSAGGIRPPPSWYDGGKSRFSEGRTSHRGTRY